MTYGELIKMNLGWVLNHVAGDMASNARFEFGGDYRNELVSEYDLRTLREKSIHFGEPLPGGFPVEVAA
jgi:hypothetical protein